MTALLLTIVAACVAGVHAGLGRDLLTNRCYGYGDCPQEPHEWYSSRCKGPGKTQTTVKAAFVSYGTLGSMIVEYGPEHARVCERRERVAAGEEAFHLATSCGETVRAWVFDSEFYNEDGKTLDKGACGHLFNKDDCATCGSYSFTVDCNAWDGEPCEGESGECVAGAVRNHGCGCVTKYKTTECRAADGPCSPAVSCSGDSATCPAADTGATDGDVCKEGEGPCQGDSVCEGGACKEQPAPIGDGEVCKEGEGPCQGSSVCESGACKEQPAPIGDGEVCKEGKGHCQGESICEQGACKEQPAEVEEGGICGGRPDGPCQVRSRCKAGVCEARFRNKNFVCRVGTGKCDPDETCDGVSAECPQDICIDGSFAGEHSKDD